MTNINAAFLKTVRAEIDAALKPIAEKPVAREAK